MSEDRVHHVLVEPTEGVRRAAEGMLAWCARDLGLSPAPVLRFFAPTSLEEARGSGRRSFNDVPLNGVYSLDDPGAVWIAVDADLETVAHEARHLWQARRFGSAAFVRELEGDLEADARAYAAGAVPRYRSERRAVWR